MTIESTHFRANVLGPEDLLTAELGGDTSAELAAHLLLASKDTREATSIARRAEEERLRQSEDRQVDALHDQADAIRAGGVTRGVTQMAAGVANIVGAGVALSGPCETAQITLTGYKGFGDVASGAGNLVAGLYDGAAKDAEANSVAAGHRAGESERRLNDLDEADREARDLARTALDFQRETRRIQADTDAATIFLRG